MSRRYRVATAYTCAYPKPLTAAAGAQLTVDDHAESWPGWIWSARG